jgi:hypothetical protein
MAKGGTTPSPVIKATQANANPKEATRILKGIGTAGKVGSTAGKAVAGPIGGVIGKNIAQRAYVANVNKKGMAMGGMAKKGKC